MTANEYDRNEETSQSETTDTDQYQDKFGFEPLPPDYFTFKEEKGFKVGDIVIAKFVPIDSYKPKNPARAPMVIKSEPLTIISVKRPNKQTYILKFKEVRGEYEGCFFSHRKRD